MMELWNVVIKADTAGASAANAALDKMTAASRSADTAIANLGRNSAAGFGAVEKAAQAAAREADRMAAKAAEAAQKAQRLMASQRTNLMFQLNDVGVSLAGGMNPLMVLAQQGSQIAMIYEGGVVPALRETAAMAGRAALAFYPIAAAVGIASLGVGALTREMHQAGATAVNFGDVAAAVLQVPARAIYDLLQPAITSVSGWWATEMDIFADQTKMIVNFLTRNFLVAFETVKSGIMTLPDAFIVAGEAAANGFLKGIEWLVQQAAEKLNGLMGPFNALRELMGNDPIQLIDPATLTIPPANLGGTAAQGRINAEASALAGRTASINSTDYAGQWFGALTGQAAANAASRLAEESAGAMSKAQSAAEKATNAYNDLVQSAEQRISQAKLEMQSIGMTAEAAARLRYEQELLNKAANDNIKLSPQQRAQLGHLAEGMAAAEEATRRLQEVYDQGKSAFGGFFSDLRRNLMDGQDAWTAFGGAAVNALNQIAEAALNNASDGQWSRLLDRELAA